MLAPFYKQQSRVVNLGKQEPDLQGMSPGEAAYLAAIVDSSEDAIIAKDLDGRITAWNPGAEALFGYRAEEMIGRHISILFPPDQIQEEDAILARIGQGERIQHYETVRRHKDGRDVQVSLTVSPIRDAEGRIIGASKIARAIGARLEAEAQMRDLREELAHLSRLSAMGQMAAAIAHELNQPLSSISNYLSGVQRLLGSGAPDPATVGQGVAKALEQTVRAGEILRRVRHFVERSDGERRVEDLAQVTEEGLQLLSPLLRNQCEVRFSADPETPPVLADRVQIQQVLLNLLRNAVEAMAMGDTRVLQVTVEPADGFAAIRVADTGPGIDPVIAAQLFQPFVTSKSSGMGVGLSICRTIVEAHGGRIWAESHPAGGALFSLVLPPLEGREDAAAPRD